MSNVFLLVRPSKGEKRRVSEMTASQFRSQPFDRCQRPAHVFKCCLKLSFFSSSEIKSKNEATSSNYNSVSGLETELEMSYIDSNDSWARGMATGGNKASLALNLYLFRFFFKLKYS